MKRLYSYDGPVYEFGTCAIGRWQASTYATSEAQAKNNMAYQYKKKFGMYPNAKVTLPGKLKTNEGG